MTAEEFFIKIQKEKGYFQNYDANSVAADYIQNFAIEFAKYHVEQALSKAVENIGVTEENMELTSSILNSYPLNLIY